MLWLPPAEIRRRSVPMAKRSVPRQSGQQLRVRPHLAVLRRGELTGADAFHAGHRPHYILRRSYRHLNPTASFRSLPTGPVGPDLPKKMHHFG